MWRALTLMSFALIASLAWTATAEAQFGTNSARQRPFQNTPTRPTTSPYLNLLNNTNRGVPNYQNLVRPQLEQQSINRNQAFELQQLQVQQAQQAVQSRQGNVTLPPTGHRTTFMTFSHFYPALGR